MNNLAEAANLIEHQANTNLRVNAIRSAAFASTHPNVPPSAFMHSSGSAFYKNRSPYNSSESRGLGSLDRLQSLSSAALNELLKQSERDKLRELAQEQADSKDEEEIGYSLDASPSQRVVACSAANVSAIKC